MSDGDEEDVNWLHDYIDLSKELPDCLSRRFLSSIERRMDDGAGEYWLTRVLTPCDSGGQKFLDDWVAEQKDSLRPLIEQARRPTDGKPPREPATLSALQDRNVVSRRELLGGVLTGFGGYGAAKLAIPEEESFPGKVDYTGGVAAVILTGLLGREYQAKADPQRIFLKLEKRLMASYERQAAPVSSHDGWTARTGQDHGDPGPAR